MNLLAFEMSSPQGSIALQVNGQYEQIMLSTPRKQIEQVLPVIDGLLQKFNLQVSDLDYLLLSIGPGSFTGLRVALGIVQGLSLAHEIPVLSLSSLNILAQTAHRLTEAKEVVCCVNAFMGQVYIGHYCLNSLGQMMPAQDDKVIDCDAISFENGLQGVAAGNGWLLTPKRLTDESMLTASDILYPQAEDMVILAAPSMATGSAQSIYQVKLNYLRDKSAWQKAG